MLGPSAARCRQQTVGGELQFPTTLEHRAHLPGGFGGQLKRGLGLQLGFGRVWGASSGALLLLLLLSTPVLQLPQQCVSDGFAVGQVPASPTGGFMGRYQHCPSHKPSLMAGSSSEATQGIWDSLSSACGSRTHRVLGLFVLGNENKSLQRAAQPQISQQGRCGLNPQGNRDLSLPLGWLL